MCQLSFFFTCSSFGLVGWVLLEVYNPNHLFPMLANLKHLQLLVDADYYLSLGRSASFMKAAPYMRTLKFGVCYACITWYVHFISLHSIIYELPNIIVELNKLPKYKMEKKKELGFFFLVLVTKALFLWCGAVGYRNTRLEDSNNRKIYCQMPPSLPQGSRNFRVPRLWMLCWTCHVLENECCCIGEDYYKSCPVLVLAYWNREQWPTSQWGSVCKRTCYPIP